MPENILRLNILVADFLKEIQILKNALVRESKYDQALAVRDAERQIEMITEKVLSFSYPWVPTIGLPVYGKLYSSELFRYAQRSHWKNVPQNILDLLISRKDHLDGLISFTDSSAQKLIDLNRRLTHEEKRIEDFLKFVNAIIALIAVKGTTGNLNFGSITMEFYTNSNYYNTYGDGFGTKTPFFEYEIPVVELSDSIAINSGINDQDSTIQNLEFLDTLAVDFWNEKICFIFSLLANNGLLAWEDMINIDRISISLPLGYQFQETGAIS